MKRAIKLAVIILAVAFVALQFFQIDKTEEPIEAREMLEASVRVGPNVSMILSKACNDCHSNKTIYPWYAYVQPFGWFVKSHIEDGRRHLNFSKFSTYDPAKRAKKLEEICEEVRAGSMPLPSYTWIHRDAVLTQSEKNALCDWTEKVNAEK